MLFNFCDSRLKPKIRCDTVCTEGHEVTNLINDSDKGFLAYACIKPPINIDITFLYNLSINHILIWPQVGSQKSSGFQLYAKTSNDSADTPYTLLASGFLDSQNTGLLFHPSNVIRESISAPSSFLKRYIKPSLCYLTTQARNIRIRICKTDNSVPALKKIEVWGTVSPCCQKDIVAKIYTLWTKTKFCSNESKEMPEDIDTKVSTVNSEEILESTLQVPDCFLDAITYEIMTQPILLPSGKIIDQSTLLKHEETQAVLGRSLTDPFTGLPFSETRKPVIASSLKIRIDKFLLENSNAEEIKKLPRVLGRASRSEIIDKKVEDVPEYLLRRNVINNKPKLNYSLTSVQAREKLCHKLPVVVMSRKRNVWSVTESTTTKRVTNKKVCKEAEVEEKADRTLEVDLTVDYEVDFDIDTAVPTLKRFNRISTAERNETSSILFNCSCCSNATFYRLPCKHVLCRKVLTSIENNQCTLCRKTYKNSEIEKIHK